jgi:pyruvate/2-oxoglutarate dehydrogenase complex dihydrolipoamide dehydrogenase (E3) component
MKKYDLILIGTGQATGTVVPAVLEMGMSIAVIEGDRVGGSCVNWGCTPTKTLVASARAVHMARRGPEFGVDIPRYSVSFPRVMERVNAMRYPGSDGMRAWLEEVTDFYPGWASFVDEHRLRAGEELLYGERIVIHTGARARTPEIEGIDAVPWLDNRGILALERLPEHLLVLGGSYIGMEFAQAFRRLGSRVSVFEHNERIVPREDPDVSDIALRIMRNDGVEFHFESEARKLEPLEEGLRLRYEQGGELRSISGSHILIAVGRTPNTEGLELEAAGVRTGARGHVEVDEVGRSSVPHIYALGDVNGRGAFTHTSVHDGQVFLDHLRGRDWRRIDRRQPIHAMYIDPPLARVGMSEEEARRSGKRALVGRMPMNQVSRAKEKDETDGLMKVVVEAETGLILGATIFGVGGDEIIGMLALAMQAGLPYTRLQETVIPHPTVGELVPWLFAELEEID